MAPRQNANDIAIYRILPGNGLARTDRAARIARRHLRQNFRRLGAAQIKTRHIYRRPHKFHLRLAPRHDIWLNKHNGRRVQKRRIQPVLLRIEIHQHDGAVCVLAIEIGQGAAPHIDDRPRQSLCRHLTGPHMIGP